MLLRLVLCFVVFCYVLFFLRVAVCAEVFLRVGGRVGVCLFGVSVPCPGQCRVVVCFVRGRVACWCALSGSVPCFGVFCPGACRVSVCVVRGRVMCWCVVFGRVSRCVSGAGRWRVVFGVRVFAPWCSVDVSRRMECSGSVCLLRGVRGCASARGNRGRVSCVMYCVVGAPCVASGSFLLRLVSACLLFF